MDEYFALLSVLLLIWVGQITMNTIGIIGGRDSVSSAVRPETLYKDAEKELKTL